MESVIDLVCGALLSFLTTVHLPGAETKLRCYEPIQEQTATTLVTKVTCKHQVTPKSRATITLVFEDIR